MDNNKNGKFWDRGCMLVTGCSHVSEGCLNCWSEKQHVIMMHTALVSYLYNPNLMNGSRFNGRVQFNIKMLKNAVKSKTPQVIAIWNDFWHEGVTDSQRTNALLFMSSFPQHTFLIVTKRPEAAARYHETAAKKLGIGIQLPDNIWHIVTIESQLRVEYRMEHLLKIPGKRGIIIEPMLGPVNLDGCRITGMEGSIGFLECVEGDVNPWLDDIHQVIVGGETGPGARPLHPDWVRGIRTSCEGMGVPFYFKSWGEWQPVEPLADEFPTCGEIADGKYRQHDWDDYRYSLRVGSKLSGRILDGREHNDLAWRTL